MIPTLATFLQTITGKVVLGITVATASVGAAAAGAPVPIVQDLVPGTDGAQVAEHETSSTSTTVADDDDDDGDDEEVDGGSEPGIVVDGSTNTADDDEGTEKFETTEGDEAGGEAATEDDEPNHGEIVSGFATTTDLTGCERGQAVSAVARGILDPDDPDFDTQLAARLDELGKCQDGDDESEDADGEEAIEEDDEPNHGEIVSGFATTTDLTGCVRGQAVSAVARGELDPQSDAFDTELATFVENLDKCKHDDADTDADQVDSTDEDDGGQRGPTKDKSDKPGKSGTKGNRPAHAGQKKP